MGFTPITEEHFFTVEKKKFFTHKSNNKFLFTALWVQYLLLPEVSNDFRTASKPVCVT
jgi:hypothetical protein